MDQCSKQVLTMNWCMSEKKDKKIILHGQSKCLTWNFYQSTEPSIYLSTKCYKPSIYIWKLYFSYHTFFKNIWKVINRIWWLYFSPSGQLEEMHFHTSDNQTFKLEYFEAQIQFSLSYGKKKEKNKCITILAPVVLRACNFPPFSFPF